MQRILVVMAMEDEARPVLEALGAAPVVVRPGSASSTLPMRWSRAVHHGCTVELVRNGDEPRHGVPAIGTVAAALTTFAALHELRHDPGLPDLLISAGTAGGWQARGAAVGDVYVSRDRFVHHDRRIAIPGFDAMGVGSYPAARAGALARALGAKTGIVTTSDSLDETDDDRRMIAANGGDVKEMEAAAVAEVAERFGVPMVAIKAITDLVDHHEPTAEQFAANLAHAARRIADALLLAIEWCAPRTVADLA